MANILAVAEQRDGSLRRVSNEVVTAAKTLAEAMDGEVHVLVAGGAGVGGEASGLGTYGADRILVAEAEVLGANPPDALAKVVTRVAKDGGYGAVLFAATAVGKDLAPRVAARLDAPLAADATGLSVEGGALVVRRPMYAGKAFATLVLKGAPVIVSIRPNVFTPEERSGRGDVETIDAGVSESDLRVRVREFRAAEGEAVDVAEAPIVVSGGRGMQSPENWSMLEDLRDAFGPAAALGASRAVVDAGWRPHAEQVGQTGKTVAPQLYVAVGISGAIQHLAGMRTARTIVAVNKDPDAPIFGVADYGIVGDAFEVVPKLTEAVRSARQG